MFRKALLTVLVIAALAGVIALVAVLTASPPEKTVERFFSSIEKRDEAALRETLSTDAGEVALLLQTLSPDSPAMVKVFLRDGLSDRQVENLVEYLRQMPEVKGIIYAPNRRAGYTGLTTSTQPPGLDVTIDDPRNYRTFAARLAARPEVRINPETRKQDIVIPVGDAVYKYMSRALPGVKFTDMKYKTTVLGDRATVVVLDGKILKLDEKGNRVPVDATELRNLGIFPVGFTLRNVDGRWVITSFPEVQVQ